MAKLKAAKPKKSKAGSNVRGALPCAVILISAMLLLFLLFSALLSSRG